MLLMEQFDKQPLQKQCHPDVVSLYSNLRKVLKHFSQSTKSTEMLNNALNAMEHHDIHMLVWGSTRMAGFLDACK